MIVYPDTRSVERPVDYTDKAHEYVFTDIVEVTVEDETGTRTEYSSTMTVYAIGERDRITIEDLADAIDVLTDIILEG